MTNEQKERIAAVLADVALDTAESEPQSYSGRGMYGAVCLGIVGPEAELFSTLLRAAMDLADEDLVAGVDITGALVPHRDSMGTEQVWYWPGLPVPPEVREYEEWREDDE